MAVVRIHTVTPPETGMVAVEIFDRTLRLRRRVAVGREPREVELDGYDWGPYLARGWSADGALLSAQFDLSDEDIMLTAVESPIAPPDTPMVHSEWATVWIWTGRRWRSTEQVLRPGQSWAEVPEDYDRDMIALQLGDSTGPTYTALARVDVVTRIARATAAEDGMLTAGPQDDLSALLGYLRSGDLGSAVVVADELHNRSRDSLTPVAVAYTWFLTGREGWQRFLGTYSGSGPRDPSRGFGRADALVLLASAELQRPDPNMAEVLSSLRQALRAGLPLVPVGIRLLADAVDLVPPESRGRSPFAADLVRIRSVQRAMRSAPLTTYASLTPNLPIHRVPPPGPPTAISGWWEVRPRPARRAFRFFAALTGNPERKAERELRDGPLTDEQWERLRGRFRPRRDGQTPTFTPPPKAFVLPVFSLQGPRLANTDLWRDEVRPAVDTTASGIRITRRAVGSDRALVSARVPVALAGSGQDPLLELYVGTDSFAGGYLILLSPARHDDNVLDGQLLLPGARSTLDTAVVGVRDAAELGAADSATVTRSVLATDLPAARDAWREFAAGRSDDDPVAVAIRAGLR